MCWVEEEEKEGEGLKGLGQGHEEEVKQPWAAAQRRDNHKSTTQATGWRHMTAAAFLGGHSAGRASGDWLEMEMSLFLYLCSAPSSRSLFMPPPLGGLATTAASISGTDCEIAIRDWRAASTVVNSDAGAAAGEAINRVLLFMCTRKLGETPALTQCKNRAEKLGLRALTGDEAGEEPTELSSVFTLQLWVDRDDREERPPDRGKRVDRACAAASTASDRLHTWIRSGAPRLQIGHEPQIKQRRVLLAHASPRHRAHDDEGSASFWGFGRHGPVVAECHTGDSSGVLAESRTVTVDAFVWTVDRQVAAGRLYSLGQGPSARLGCL
nr:unnamed protein product [Digitaria exilis]